MNETTEAVQYKYSKPNVFAVVKDIKFHSGICRRSTIGRTAKFGGLLREAALQNLITWSK